MRVTTGKLCLLLLLPLGLLLTCQLLGIYSAFMLGHDSLLGFIPLFDMGEEGNVPTWYSSFLLLAAGGMAFVCRHAESSRRMRAYWAGLIGIFLYLSLDEAAQLHEHIGRVANLFIVKQGVLYFPWVAPFAILAMIVGVLYLRFLFLLPPRTAVMFVAAGVLYLGGAIGFEMIQALLASGGDTRSLSVHLVVTAEETLEMCGPSLFIYGAHAYLRQAGATIRLSFA